MIPQQDLARWLDDRVAQSASVSLGERIRCRIRDLPAFARLESELERATAGGSEATLACAERFLEDGADVERCVGMMIDAAREDPFFRPPLRTAGGEVHSSLLLLSRPELNISLSLATAEAIAAKRTFRAGRASIAFTGYRSIFKFLRSGGAVLSFWEAPQITSCFTAAGSGKCRMVERRAVEQGEMFALDGSRRSFVVEHAAGDILYLQAATPVGAAPLLVEYDSETLEYAGASSADEASSRIQMMLSMLRVMDRQDASPLFARMLGSPHFYARWHAMREFLALDPDQALPHLRRMAAGDPHAEVRAAAARTLGDLLGETVPTAEEQLACHA